MRYPFGFGGCPHRSYRCPLLNGRNCDFPFASQVHISTVSESNAKCTMARRFGLNSSSSGLRSVLYCLTACSVRWPVRLFFQLHRHYRDAVEEQHDVNRVVDIVR